MSVKHLLVCDGPECDKSQAYYPPEWGGRAPVPGEWFILAKGDNGTESMHFCSLDCLTSWAKDEPAHVHGYYLPRDQQPASR